MAENNNVILSNNPLAERFPGNRIPTGDSSRPVPKAIQEFMNAIQSRDATKLVDLQEKNNINIPLEFETLSKPSAKVAELIVTYKLFKGGQLTEQDWKDYLRKQWVGLDVEKRHNKFASTNYRAANGKTLKFITEGPDSGKYWSVSDQTTVTAESHADWFPVKAVSSEKVENKRAEEAYDTAENAAIGIRNIDEIAGEIKRVGGQEGWFGLATEFIKGVLGAQESSSTWKTKFRGFINAEVVNNLPPGVASDKDIELARSGFPDENWDQNALLLWMAGYRKQLMFSQAYFRAKGDYIYDTGNRKGFNVTTFYDSPEGKQALNEILAFSYGAATAGVSPTGNIPADVPQETLKANPGKWWGPASDGLYYKWDPETQRVIPGSGTSQPKPTSRRRGRK